MNEKYIYKPAVKLDMLGNKHKLIDRLNAFAVISIMVCCVAGAILNYCLRMPKSPGGIYFVTIFGGFWLCVAYIYLHELTHAFAIITVTGEKPEIKFGKFAASCGAPIISFTKKQYLYVASFPFVFYCLLLVPLCILLPPLYFPLTFMPLCYNVFGSMGDMYMIRKMIASPKNSVIVDNGTDVCAYMPDADLK